MQVVCEPDRRNKSVAPSGIGRDIPSTILAVSEHSAQHCHLDLKITFLDVGIRPYAGDQLNLCNDLAWPIKQCSEDIEGAAAQANGIARVQKEPLGRHQAEGAKQDSAWGCAIDPICFGRPKLVDPSTLPVALDI